MSAEMRAYFCFNVELHSEIELPELPLATGDRLRPIVEVRRASLPHDLANASGPIWGLQVAGREALLAVPDVGRFLIARGERILFDSSPSASARQVRLFLLGSVLGILAHQRGLLPLHANAVELHGGAYAFCGPSGAGKSTLAAHFEQAGYSLLADDVCPVEIGSDGIPLAWPGVPKLKLWPDAASALGHDISKLEYVTETIEKYHIAHARPSIGGPVPLRRLYVLGRAQTLSDRSIIRLSGRDAMNAVLANIYRGMYLSPLGRAVSNFHQCAALLRSTQVFAATRCWGFDAFGEEAAMLENHMHEEKVNDAK